MQKLFTLCSSLKRSNSRSCGSFIRLSEEVKSGMKRSKAIVALESTIVTHGMPFPTNFETAVEVEDIVRKNGVIPATIAVINGLIKVGLTADELRSLSMNKDVVKASKRDLPFLVTKSLSGGTTVAATMAIAQKAGIKCFATGGIGGVHRGAELTFDISADLHELGITPITVFSSGIKSILDIEKSLEYLETQGVSVAVLNQDVPNDALIDFDFPGFYSSRSGFKVPYNLKSVEEAANLIYNHEKLRLQNGILIAIPIPEKFDLSPQVIDEAINSALIDAQNKGIKGKDVTPFVLQRVTEITSGQSLKSNVSLIKNNADIASKVSFEFNKIKNQSSFVFSKEDNHEHNNSVVVAGASILDTILHVNASKLTCDGTTLSGKTSRTVGGVGRNLADCMNKLGHNVFFLSCLGDDENGNVISRVNPIMNTSGIKVLKDTPTSTAHVLVNKQGETALLILDTNAIQQLTKDHISKHVNRIKTANVVMIDSNIPLQTIEYILNVCTESGVPVLYEPTDPRIAAKIYHLEANCRKCLVFASPNLQELKCMYDTLNNSKTIFDINADVIKNTKISKLQEMCQRMGEKVLEDAFTTLVITLGPKGVILMSKDSLNNVPNLGPGLNFDFKMPSNHIEIKHFQALSNSKIEIVNSSGAGDCFISGFMSGVLRKKSLSKSVDLAFLAAEMSLKSNETVPENIKTLRHT